MNQNELERFTALMGIMQEAFIPEKPLSKERIKIYFDYLKDLSIDDIEKSTHHILNVKKIPTFPTIGEIRGYIEVSMEDKALENWHLGMNNLDSYVSVKFEDPVVHSVIEYEFGGWEKFCNLCIKDEAWDKRRFIQAYLLYAKRGEHPKYLPGFFERENKLHGYNYDEGIKQIGRTREIKKLKE